MCKIFISESIERILKRIVDVYKKDIENHRVYCHSITKDGKTYTGTDTVRIKLEYFEEFKASLENGTSDLLICEKGKEDEAKLDLLDAISKWYEPLCQNDINAIENDVYVQEELMKLIIKMSSKKLKEAQNLLNFINDYSPEVEHYQIKDFRLVNSEEDFKKILTAYNTSQELTSLSSLKENFNDIRISMISMDAFEIYKKKGIYEDYKKFFTEHISDDLDSYIKMFNIWHDVRETAIFYIYVPK